MMFPSGALVKRELLTTLRRTRIMVWLVLLVLCCIAVVWANWPDAESSPFGVANQMTSILAGLYLVLLGGCVLFIPSVSAAAIVSEREQDTIDLLRMSLVRGSGIVFAKFLNAVGLFALLIIAVAPAIGTTLFGVGLDPASVVQVFIALVTVAITSALAGLASSAFFRKTIWAVIGAYFFTIVAFVTFPILASALELFDYFGWEFISLMGPSGMQYGPIRSQLEEMVMFGSLPAMVTPVTAAILIFEGSWSGWWVLLSVILQVPFWILFLLLTMRWLRKRDPHAVIVNEELIDDVEILRSRREQFPYYILDPLKRKKPIEDSRNPMFVREVRWGLFTRMTVLMRLCLAVFAMFFIASLFPVLYDNRETSAEIIMGWAAVQYFVTMMFAPALVANSFTKEIELGNIDMIRMTLMQPRQILAGKAGAGFIVLSPVIVAVLVASFPLLFIGIHALPELATSAITGVVWAGYCVAVSLTVSLFAKRTLGALIVSYGIVAFTYLILNPLVEFFWHRYTLRYNIDDVLAGRHVEGPDPSWVTGAKLLNPTTSALSDSTFNTWCINTAVTLAIIATCYGLASYVLTQYRMQDR